ncbi:MAG: TatD family hydrolase [Candidatus Magasanikbacteria bacterium]|nr:TatD family hydrolase [Candidatus Magasanikbacteria bacterium]
MVKLIDTHAHLQFEKFDTDREEVVKNNSKELLAVINPGADLNSSENAVLLATKVKNFYAAIGVHPHHVDHWNKTYLSRLEELIQKEKVVAVGEIGLDNHEYSDYPKPNLAKQTKILLPQIALAQKYKKPILFHCRLAYDELYEVIKSYQPLTGLLHCFMGDTRTAQKFIELGLLISFAGNLTYKSNLHMQEAAKSLLEDKIVLETDSPYLTPEPLRGQRNQPLNVLLVAQKIAQLRNTTIENVANFTNQNSTTLFSI